MKLTFYGGARTVTGSSYLLETKNGKTKILIDCGLHQGSNFAERQNFDPFPYDPKEIQAVFVTHAHIDHTGLLPKLYKDGFRGKIFSTPATRDFSEFLLLDSEHLLSEEANRERKPVLYTQEDVEAVMRHWEGVEYHQKIDWDTFKIEFFDAGHILGSAFIRVESDGQSVVFSGDLGNSPAPIINPTEELPEADYCLIESAYGDRIHEDVSARREMLEDAIEDTVRSRGVLVIPAFAMERTQQLLYELNDLIENGRIPKIPIYIDSPLAIKLTEVYRKYHKYFNRGTSDLIKGGDDVLNFKGLTFTPTTEDSKRINDVPAPKVIIAGSGMSNGGRVLHHEFRYLPDPKSMLLLVGYQAEGSMGRQLLEGAKAVRIFGEEVPVHAKVRMISGYSAHADQPRLLDWLATRKITLKKVFVVQGDEGATAALAKKINDELVIHTEIPEYKEEVEL
ncbi:MAG: MBL fold metallo-hydrolase [Candidatus Paceibacterota bacterium]|jgi:metallo-beta-lactamase family protein